MGRGHLTDEEWARLKPRLPKTGQRGGRWANHRRIINGGLYRIRTGVPWRDLPARFGKWKTVYERHRRWSADGRWDKIYASVLADADTEGRIDWSMVSVDSIICRAHHHAAGARKKRPRVARKGRAPRQHRPDEGLGRSRSTSAEMKSSGRSTPSRAPGRSHEIRQACLRLPGHRDRRSDQALAPGVDPLSPCGKVTVTVLQNDLYARFAPLGLRADTHHGSDLGVESGARRCRTDSGTHGHGCGRSPTGSPREQRRPRRAAVLATVNRPPR
ncbi:IS5 family transposase [Streptomyces parvus]|uniref:IS5 family transposase n=1 Tax=Streptomyces parvus TaxID=66428 RepID=UPI0033D0692A